MLRNIATSRDFTVIEPIWFIEFTDSGNSDLNDRQVFRQCHKPVNVPNLKTVGTWTGMILLPHSADLSLVLHHYSRPHSLYRPCNAANMQHGEGHYPSP